MGQTSPQWVQYVNPTWATVDQRRRAQILREFERLQDEMLEIAAYVPLVPDFTDTRYGIASPRIAEFGLDCGTWVETLLCELLDDERSDMIPGIAVARTELRLSIDDFKKLLGPRYGLAKGGYRLRDHDGPELRPFEEWERDENPEWFRTYSRLKHSRFELADSFTLGHALRAFCALELLVSHWPGYEEIGYRPGPEQPRSRVLYGRRV